MSPDPTAFVPTNILLASEGRAIPQRAVDRVAQFAKHGKITANVFSIARIWGTALGLPNPGLLPNKLEWDQQRQIAANAVAALRAHGIDSSGHVLGARNAAKKIVAEAQRLRCDAIVMAADPPRHWFIRGMIWSQEPYRVRAMAEFPVYLILEE